MPNLYTIDSIGKPNVYKRISTGGGLPITVNEAKQQLFIPIAVTTWDTEIEAYIKSGIAIFEKMTKQTLIVSTYTGYFNIFPTSIRLKKAPFVAIVDVKYDDESGVEQTVTNTNYYTTVSDYYSHLIFIDDFDIPKTLDRPQIFRATFTSGIATDNTDTPEDIKLAMKMLVAYLYENRGDCVAQGNIPSVITNQFFPYKIIDIVRNDIC